MQLSYKRETKPNFWVVIFFLQGWLTLNGGWGGRCQGKQKAVEAFDS